MPKTRLEWAIFNLRTFTKLVQGVGGTIVPPTDWVRRLRQICNERELLLVLLANLSAKAMGIGQTIALEILDFAKDKIILDK
jgi:hypothetical protein